MLPDKYSFLYLLALILLFVILASLPNQMEIAMLLIGILFLLVGGIAQWAMRAEEKAISERRLKAARKEQPVNRTLSPEETQQLITQLADPDKSRRNDARNTLTMSNFDLSLLFEALHSKNNRLRIEAAKVIGYLEDNRIESQLLARLDDTDPEFLKAVLRAMGILQAGLWRNLMEQGRTHGNSVENTLNAHISRIKSALLGLMEALLDQPADRTLFNRARDLLNHYNDEAALNLFLSLAVPNTPYTVHAVAGLDDFINDPRAIDALLNLIKTESFDNLLVINQLVAVLSTVSDPRIFDAVLPLLKHPNPYVRGWVVFRMQNTGDTRFIEPFKTLFKDKAIAFEEDRGQSASVADLARDAVKELQNKSSKRT